MAMDNLEELLKKAKKGDSIETYCFWCNSTQVMLYLQKYFDRDVETYYLRCLRCKEIRAYAKVDPFR